ncbi:unnamed protein product, partial [Didymodactylos carnosus]
EDKHDLNSFRQEALNKHNEYRRQHDVPTMTLDSELNSIAQNYAEHLACSNKLEHSSTNLGEYLYTKMSTGNLDVN